MHKMIFKSGVEGQLKMGSVTHTVRKGGSSQMTEGKYRLTKMKMEADLVY